LAFDISGHVIVLLPHAWLKVDSAITLITVIMLCFMLCSIAEDH